MKNSTILSLFAALEGCLVVMADTPEMDAIWSEARKTLSEAKNEHHSTNDLWAEMVNHYGREAQMEAFVEELGEVLQAQNKVRRHNWSEESVNHFAEELVDAGILLEQMKTLVPPQVLEAWETHKMQRVVKRLSKSKMERAQAFQAAVDNSAGLQNLFNCLHEKGMVATFGDMVEIMDAMKRDLSLAEQEQLLEAPEGEAPGFLLEHDGTSFIPAENGIEVHGLTEDERNYPEA